MTTAGLMIAMLIGGAQVALAHGHEHGDIHNLEISNPSKNMKGGFLTTKEIDGYAVSFHIMKASASMTKGDSHHLMIKVEQKGKILNDLMVNSKVVYPDGKSESKMLMKMGDWYMTSYDFSHLGKHQVMVLFKTSDGKKHFGGVVYSKKPS